MEEATCVVNETACNRNELIEEEVFLILHSGEIPEIAYYNAIYHLTRDPDGPSIELRPDDFIPLEEAVVKRYLKIIMRDLDPRNRDRRIYRGLERCAVNWKRLSRFSDNRKIDLTAERDRTAQALKAFLAQELEEVLSGRRTTSINCPYAVVVEFAKELGIPRNELPEGLKTIC